MRILVATLGPLVAERGAAQVALRLAEALRERGHEVVTWCPSAESSRRRRWDPWRAVRRELDQALRANPGFEVVDAPGVWLPSDHSGYRTVARSTQPELLYLRVAIQSLLRTERNPARLALGVLEGLRQRQDVISAWRRATHILCLGSAELDWMRRRFPSMSSKMSCYLHAPSDEDRVSLFEIRHARRRGAGEPVRFLWLGRWVAHKGPGELIRFARSRLKGEDSLTIAGCEPLREPPAELASLGSRIRIVPHYSRQQLGVLLREHDVGLFTSRVEGWGLSLQEMLESGMPVLATRTGGVVDLQPWFPQSLLPLWSEGAADCSAAEDLVTDGYLERFSWRTIAENYEREALD